MRKLSLEDRNVKGKKVLIRVDFNVPQDKSGNITDDSRIVASIPTIQYVLAHGGSVILMSHLGRPKNGPSPELSLRQIAQRLEQLLKVNVIFVPDCIGPEVKRLASGLLPGQVLLLENLRFYEAEELPEKDPSFAQQLAELGDLYVNDAFGTAHRAHSSTAIIAQYFPGNSMAGLLMEKEIAFLGAMLRSPARPFQAIIGGAKVSSKIGVLKALIGKVDALLVGGGMAYTFFKAQGLEIGDSIHEDSLRDEALKIIAQAQKAGVKLLLPVDSVVELADGSTAVIQTSQGIPKGAKGMDIGPQTTANFLSCLRQAKTILWNGPLGVFEDARFALGTQAIARELPNIDATTIVGGGDSLAAIHAAGVAERISHLSTGGGASLEYIEAGALPGIDALSDQLTTNNSN